MSNGETIWQQFSLPLPAHTSAPALYWFNVGVYRYESGASLPVKLGDLPLADQFVRLGPFVIVPDSAVPPVPTLPLAFTFDDAIRLYGYDVAARPAGDGLKVTLYWQATAVPAVEWKVFVHLLDGDGRVISQSDALPAGGSFPTSWWRPGDWTSDPHTLIVDLPPDSALSTWSLRVGLYDPVGGSRAPAADGGGHLQPDGVVALPIPGAAD